MGMLPVSANVLKFCIASVCITAVYLTFYTVSLTNSDENSTWTCRQLSRDRGYLNCTGRTLETGRSNKILCSCDQTGKVNTNKDGSAPDLGDKVTKESISITHNPRDLTTRHINYFPPDEPRSGGLGRLKLPDSLPWKSLELRLIYVLKVLRRSSKVVNVTRSINDLKGVVQIIEDIHTKLDLAHRSSEPESEPLTRDEKPATLNATLGNSAAGHRSSPVIAVKSGSTLPRLCPETFKGTVHGYPFYDTGWAVENCSNYDSLQRLVSVVVDCTADSSTTLRNFHSVAVLLDRIHPGMKVVVGVSRNWSSQSPQVPATNVSWIEIDGGAKPGRVLNTLLSKVSTPFTFVANDLRALDSDSRLQRLMRELIHLNVNVVGSALKNELGLWSLNCFQMAFRNFTAVYRAGYHHSQHECVFCNFSRGPFLANTNFLKEHKFDESLPRSVLLRDYFFKLSRLKLRLAVCPDSMQHVAAMRPLSRADWLQFARKWQIHRIRREDDTVVEFSCEQLKTGCNFRTGKDTS